MKIISWISYNKYFITYLEYIHYLVFVFLIIFTLSCLWTLNDVQMDMARNLQTD